MKRRLWGIPSGVLLAVVVLGFALAQGNRGQGRGPGNPRGGWASGQEESGPAFGWGRGNRGFGPVGLNRWVLRQLDLTDEQQDTVRALAQQFRSENQASFEQMRQVRRQLREATSEGQFDEALITELAQQQGALMAELLVSRERLRHEIFMQLTPEQQEEYSNLMNKARHRGQRRGKDSQ